MSLVATWTWSTDCKQNYSTMAFSICLALNINLVQWKTQCCGSGYLLDLRSVIAPISGGWLSEHKVAMFGSRWCLASCVCLCGWSSNERFQCVHPQGKTCSSPSTPVQNASVTSDKCFRLQCDIIFRGEMSWTWKLIQKTPKKNRYEGKISEKNSFQVGSRDKNTQEDYPTSEQWQKRKARRQRYICCMSFFSTIVPK